MLLEAYLCLSTMIYFEARGEPALGQIGVAQTAISRMIHPDYPDTLCEVVKEGRYDRRGNPLIHECQFSYWCDGRKEVVTDGEAFARAMLYGALAFVLPLKTLESTHYHSTSVSPWWTEGMEEVARIGNHIWFKEP